MLRFLIALSGLLPVLALAGEPKISASSSLAQHAPDLAFDRNDTTSWCAAELPPDAEKVTLGNGEKFDDWWEIDFQSESKAIGAIHMKSGLFKGGILQGRKARDFVWAYQTSGVSVWQTIPETDLYADRYQLIFRFAVINEVTKLRLLMRTRDPDELKSMTGNYPCLREVAFYPTTDADIPVAPWGLAVTTWEEGNIYDPLQAPEGRFDVESVIRQAETEITSHAEIDVADAIWIGEFHPIRAKRELLINRKPEYRIGNTDVPHAKVPLARGFSDWILHEPAPSFLLYSGSFWEYTSENPRILSGFYNFQKAHYKDIPSLGACGGHQITGMVLANKSFAGFADEFASNKPSHVIVPCAIQYACGAIFGEHCCREEGSKQLAPNIPGIAMKNPYQSNRVDMLLNLLPGTDAASGSSGGFAGYLHHVDSVNPARVAPDFDIIATYTDRVRGLSRKNPTLVQGMKLRDYPIYGTQFHWDESTPWDCRRDEGHRNMERVLKNFVMIGMNRLNDKSKFNATASSSSSDLGKLFDLDRATMWCADSKVGEEALLTFEFQDPTVLKTMMAVEGDTPAHAAEQSYRFEYSKDGSEWTEVAAHRQSAHEAQRNGALACESAGGTLPGVDDKQTFITTFEQPIETRYLRIRLRGAAGHPCLREIFLF